MTTALEAISAGLENAKQEFEHEKASLIKDYEDKLATLRADTARELSALKDQLLAANIQAQVQRDVAESAHAARAAAERVTTSILTKFAVAESIFADMRNFATQIAGTAASAEFAARATNGLIHKAEAAVAAIPSEARDAVEEAKAAIEAALHKA